jgi:hypothetical protein
MKTDSPPSVTLERNGIHLKPLTLAHETGLREAAREALNKSYASIASSLWVDRCVENARHSYGYGCAVLLALHPKSRRAASRGLIQRFPRCHLRHQRR